MSDETGNSGRGRSRAGTPLLTTGTESTPLTSVWINAKEHASVPVSGELAGKVTGHGAFGWRPSAVAPTPPPLEEPTDGTPPPAVVLLDGHLKPAELVDGYWDQQLLPDGPVDRTALDGPDQDAVVEAVQAATLVYGSHYGHATFIAGLVRQVAPRARLLSIPVASDDGHTDEEDILAALVRVAASGGLVDVAGTTCKVAVVLVASGRRVTASQARAELADRTTILERLRAAVVALGPDVTVVTSAGNWGSDERAYPAWFAQDLPNVVAVGALDPDGHRPAFSSWGEWVGAWERGTDVVSCMPFTVSLPRPTAGTDEATGATAQETTNAAWSGTSFAAALHAGRLAQGVGGVEYPVAQDVPPAAVPPLPPLEPAGAAGP